MSTAIKHVLESNSIADAAISLAVVDDETIRRLHERYLGIDEPTDVLSFPLSSSGEALEGEIVASAETAARRAVEFGWRAEDELLLYVVHGALHLVDGKMSGLLMNPLPIGARQAAQQRGNIDQPFRTLPPVHITMKCKIDEITRQCWHPVFN